MPVQLNISNRQRQVRFSRGWLRSMAESVVEAVINNLVDSPPAHLTAATAVGMSKHGELSLTLVSNSKMRRLNRQWREKDYPTDVLSFPLWTHPVGDHDFVLGEVIVSAERAVEQARQLGHSLERELAFLVAHGVLHILGFNHETPEEEREMFLRQRQVLKVAGFDR